VAKSTAVITSMIFVILFGASVFAIVFRQMGGDALVEEFLVAMPGGATGAMITVMIIMFVLGFILDTFEIIFIVLPITAPTLLMLGIDPIWLGVMVGVNLQTSFLTPPFGFSLFYLRGVAPNSVSTGQIYRGAVPFVILQIIAIAILFIFPGLVTWLPSVLFWVASGAAPKCQKGPGARSGPSVCGMQPTSAEVGDVEVLLARERVGEVRLLGPGPHDIERGDEAFGRLLGQRIVRVEDFHEAFLRDARAAASRMLAGHSL
jgi:hypothetical protein